MKSRRQRTEPAVDALLFDGMVLFLYHAWLAWALVAVTVFFSP
jgi:hypothetical protein